MSHLILSTQNGPVEWRIPSTFFGEAALEPGTSIPSSDADLILGFRVCRTTAELKELLGNAPVDQQLAILLALLRRETMLDLQSGSVVPIPRTPSSLLVGRHPEECDVVVSNSLVSRQHLRVTEADEGARLDDLGSKNGTTINGQTISTARLCSGDRIAIGESTFTFIADQPALVREQWQTVEEPIPAG